MWKRDKSWSDQFIPEIKSILGQHLISVANVDEDAERNTDLIVLTLQGFRVACRIRREDQMRYKNEFTIRSRRPNGNRTELSKIIGGWGDYFFYGFGTNQEPYKLITWKLARFEEFRRWMARELQSKTNRWKKQKNHDGSSEFLAFEWDLFPKEFVVAEA